MRKLGKILGLSAVVAVAGAVGWHALAQPTNPGPAFGPPFMHGMGPAMMMGWGPIAGKFGGPAQRLASLKAELGITPAQEAAWDAYAKAVEDTVTSMRAQFQKAHGAVTAAAEKLLGSLNDAQKAKSKTMLPGLAQPGPGMWHTGFGGPMTGPRGSR